MMNYLIFNSNNFIPSINNDKISFNYIYEDFSYCKSIYIKHPHLNNNKKPTCNSWFKLIVIQETTFQNILCRTDFINSIYNYNNNIILIG